MFVQSKDFFRLDGVPCDSVGLYCDTPPIQTMSDRNLQSYNVGRDEALTVYDDEYKDIQFVIQAYQFKPESYDTSEIYNYLQGKQKIQFSNCEDYYYKIRSISCTPTQKYDGAIVRYQITVRCRPFKYFVDDPWISISGSGNVENAGTLYCMPQYEVHTVGLGPASLTVNGVTVGIEGHTYLDGIITIDAENQYAYDHGNSIVTKYTSGIYQYLGLGGNYVLLGGTARSVRIKRNQRNF